MLSTNASPEKVAPDFLQPSFQLKTQRNEAWRLSAVQEINRHRSELLAPARFLRPSLDYVLELEGKRLRPLLLLCFANLGEPELTPFENEYRAAAAIELLHEASLVHDDILDNSTVRRNRASVGEQFNVRTATHAGGYITSICLATLAECDRDIGETLGASLKDLVCAQLMEELPQPSSMQAHQQRSIDIMAGKTGSLFDMAIQIGLHLNRHNKGRHIPAELATAFSRHFSLAFQMRDDLADLENDASIRKPGGNDLVQGNPTWPFLMWAQKNGDYQYAWDRLAAAKGNPETAQRLQDDIIATDTAGDVRNKIRRNYSAPSPKCCIFS
jgi:geranylgeranyl pyrophosphate synthase